MLKSVHLEAADDVSLTKRPDGQYEAIVVIGGNGVVGTGETPLEAVCDGFFKDFDLTEERVY